MALARPLRRIFELAHFLRDDFGHKRLEIERNPTAIFPCLRTHGFQVQLARLSTDLPVL